MSKQIIIDWQRDGLFVAMGSRRGQNVTIDTLVTTGGDGSSGSSTAISTQLFALAKKLDLNKAEATVIAPREVLEFRTLSVPSGDANEVPDMVRFQAQRQMANIGDNWPLDYVLLPDQAGQESLTALAATISPAHMAEIEATCSDLGIQLNRVLARPVEIARWGVSVGNLAAEEVSLVIALSRSHSDLLLLRRGTLVQLRGTRMPEDPAMAASSLVAEIRRSLIAAANHLSNDRISKVLLIAGPELANRVEAAVAQATDAPVAIVDPASMLPSSLPERHEIAQRSASRLAAIAGVIYAPNPDKRDTIDLKNFKRREPKKKRTREYAILGAVVGALALMGFYWWWSTNVAMDFAIKTATETELAKKQLMENANKVIKHRQEVDRFLQGSINWLDEVSYISTKIPPAEEVMLSNPSFDLQVDNSGLIAVDVHSKGSPSVGNMELELRDANHIVSGFGLKELEIARGQYTWTGKEVIRVQGKGWDPLAKAKATESTKVVPTPPARPGAPEPSKPAPQAPAPQAPAPQAPAPEKQKPEKESPENSAPVADALDKSSPDPRETASALGR